MYLKSGYKTITGVQLLNALALLEAKRITFRCFRVYLASFVATAIREAANRARRKHKTRKGDKAARYRICELARLCRLTEGQARWDLAALEHEKLLKFSENEIVHLRELLPEAGELASLVRSPARPVPVPRAILRFLAREKRAAVSKAMIAYMLRGLTLAKSGGEISAKGSAKLGWIAAVAGLSDRGAAYARKELIRIGWISPDTGSKQWKLNRHGAYFSINLDWEMAQSERSAAVELAPLSLGNRASFAPPIEYRKTPNGSKNQQTEDSGFLKETGTKPPNFSNVCRSDLFSLSRCEELYWQAVKAGIVRPSEHAALNFLSAAVRAREAKNGDPARIFVGIIKRALWHHITAHEEETARRGLRRCQKEDPSRFRGRSGETPLHAIPAAA